MLMRVKRLKSHKSFGLVHPLRISDLLLDAKIRNCTNTYEPLKKEGNHSPIESVDWDHKHLQPRLLLS